MYNEFIKFWGIGSAFNTKLGSNSAFFETRDSFYFIDAGNESFSKFKNYHDKNKLTYSKYNILITHLHPDHVSSLGTLIYYLYYILNVEPKIYCADKNIINMLTIQGVPTNMYCYVMPLCVIEEHIDTDVSITFLPVKHYPTLKSYALYIKANIGDHLLCIYYSGDACSISLNILREFIDGYTIDLLYQDTCGLDYQDNPHMSLNELETKIPKERREYVYCMHLDESFDEKKASSLGFNIAHVYSEE